MDPSPRPAAEPAPAQRAGRRHGAGGRKRSREAPQLIGSTVAWRTAETERGRVARPIVGVLLFNEVEVLDFAGPYEVLSRATRDDGSPVFGVVTIAPYDVVICRGGLRVLPDALLTPPALDLLIVPGGPGARDVTSDSAVLEALVRAEHARGTLVASVCTGSYLLGRAGVLDGRRATTHAARLDEFRQLFPAVHVVTDRVVDEGDLITAAGVSTGIELALYLVERFAGHAPRAESARALDGSWT